MEHIPVNPELSPVNHAPPPEANRGNFFGMPPTSHGFIDNLNYLPLVSDSSDDDDDLCRPEKKARVLTPLPVGFLDPLSPEERRAMQLRCRNNLISNHGAGGTNGGGIHVQVNEVAAGGGFNVPVNEAAAAEKKRCVKQFWKAGEYEASRDSSSIDVDGAQIAGIDHVRVHPKFLHSNATSHKWALGAIAELLDNALDEVRNGATFVNVDVLKSNKYPAGMLMVEDNGGGMTPDDIRRCMSLGYSAKSQLTNTIGQYGNGFKTSTMRLGADVIVFSRCRGKNNNCSTQSIGMLSYTFLTQTGKEDIVVPMLDYEKRGDAWRQKVRSTSEDWCRNLDLIKQWSPYEGEEDLLHQFDHLGDQGTRIVIYNLWEDEHGLPELDFQSDEHDIQIRGGDGDEKKNQMAKDYPNLRHFVNYRHSLRHYAAILYLVIPRGFRMTLRGEEVEHYDVRKHLLHSNDIVYRPQGDPSDAAKLSTVNANSANVFVGFIQDAARHLDVQGYNVYHNNRLIKPFWRVWNAAGSDGRGVIGVTEANFIQPAHDKQGFERTIMYTRLENRLVDIQKKYWSRNCHKVGYSQRVKTQTQKGSGSATSSAVPKAPVTNVTVEDQTVKSAEKFTVLNRKDETTRVFDVPVVESEMMKLKKENESLKASLEDVLLDLKREKDQNRVLVKQLEEERSQRESTRNKIIEELRKKITMHEKLPSRPHP